MLATIAATTATTIAAASVGTPALWAGFVAFVIAMLALDLGVFHRTSHEVTAREALGWSAVWVTLAALFGAGVYAMSGAQVATEFATGYLIEKALAVDNIFVFVVIFSAFGIPTVLQHRVLFWGVLGALAARAAFIGAGAALLSRFHSLIYVFGAILLFTAAKLVFHKEEDSDPRQNALYRLFTRFVPTTDGLRGDRFTVVEGGRRFATPLLAVLLLIEASDIVFAVDSIPAIFAVTRDPFIVFTSNIFAILGLRSMYFLLADAAHRFRFLKPGLAVILAFVGAKMIASGFVKVPIAASLGVILSVLVSAIALSWAFPAKPDTEPA